MSAPPLPQPFGNYALGDFAEVASPAAISWWPQTTGWWWLGAIVLALVLYRGWKKLRHWYRNRYRREAVERLQRIDSTGNSATLVADINRLLKLTALAAFSRDQVARLSGEDWVVFLNRQCPEAPFAAEEARLLAEAAYTGAPVDTAAGRRLLAASVAWVLAHENPRDD